MAATAQDPELAPAGSVAPQQPLSRTQRAQILQALAAAPSNGLPAYDVSEDSSDIDLARAAVNYADALHGGRMAGRFIGDWHLRPAAYDAASAFQQAVQQNRVRQWLEAQAPTYEGYQALRDALGRYRDIEAAGGWKALEAGSALKVGAKGPRVLKLRERLGKEHAAPTAEADPAVFDKRLAEALRAEQARLGAPVTGVLDKATITALNVPVAARIDTIEANLERWRWLPPSLPAYRIEVNLPAFWLDVHRDGQIPLSMKVIAGRPHDPTPMFSDTMERMIFNPPWNVPDGIARAEIFPKAAKDRSYLAKHDYVITPSGGLMQKAGPQSALGKFKFDLDNPFAIYLHDTPSRELFAKDMRALSHGCMRVEKPRDLALLLMEGDAEWTPDAIDQAVESGETVRAALGRAAPVFIVYRTAFVDGSGKVQFRNDLYNWDAKLKEILSG